MSLSKGQNASEKCSEAVCVRRVAREVRYSSADGWHHGHARIFARGLNKITGYTLEEEKVHTNIVFAYYDFSKAVLLDIIAACNEHGVLCNQPAETSPGGKQYSNHGYVWCNCNYGGISSVMTIYVLLQSKSYNSGTKTDVEASKKTNSHRWRYMAQILLYYRQEVFQWRKSF